MAKLGVITTQQKAEESKWKTYIDEGDGDPIRFKLRPWNRSANGLIDNRIKDKDFVKSLGIDWDRMPKGTGERREDLRAAILADYLFEDWENVEEDDAPIPLACTVINKAWLFDNQALGLWALNAAGNASVKVAEKDVKN
jgi:hypothetical protein